MFSKPSTSSSSNKGAAKRKRVVLTIQQKLEIISRLEKGVNRNFIMNDFNIGSSTIYDIKKQKDELQKFAAQAVTEKNMETRHTLKKPKLEFLDEALYTWFRGKRSEGKPVTGPMITEKAKQFHQELGLETECVFSDGWLQKFKIRHGIRRLDVAGESRSADENAAEEYKGTFSSLVSKWNLNRCQVYNADETGLLWRCLPTSTLAGGDEKCAKGFKKNKDRLTVLLCANASGDHQLTPVVIGKFKKPRALKGVVNLPVHYDAQSNAWMTADLFKDWFFHHFVPEVKENLKKRGMPEDSRVLLLLDNCTAHPPAHELVSGKIFAAYLPPNVTALIQPMDQGVIQNFKCHYRGSFVQGLLNSDCDVKNFQKQFNVKDAIFATALSWKEVKEVTLQRCWRKLWPIDEDPDEVLDLNNIGQNTVLNLIEGVETPFKDVPHEEMVDWIEIDKDEPVVEELSDEQIIQNILNPQQMPALDVDSDEEEGAMESVPQVSWKEASDALNTFISFAESHKSFNTTELINLCIIRKEFLQKKSDSRKQRDIRDFFKK